MRYVIVLVLLCISMAFSFERINGICIGLMNYKEMNKEFFENLDDLGINIIRVSVFWENVEQKEGTYNWKRLDFIVNNAQKYKKEILFVIGYLPTWITNGKYEKKFPPKIENYKRFLISLVKRYKGKVKYFEIWNEPNLKFFWKSDDKSYFRLLKISYKIIKKLSPKSIILNGGISINNDSYMYLIKLLETSSYYVDIIAIHFYYHWNIPNYKKILLLKEVVNVATLYNKPVWITETGIPSGGFNKETYTKGGLFIYDQAKELAKLILLTKSVDNKNIIKEVFLYSYKDNKLSSLKDSDNFGLLFFYGEKKPVFYTIKFLNNLVLPYIKVCRIDNISFLDSEIYCISHHNIRKFIFLEKENYLSILILRNKNGLVTKKNCNLIGVCYVKN